MHDSKTMHSLKDDSFNEDLFKDYIGKSIAKMTIDNDILVISFFDGDQSIEFCDYAQSCCENRYMRTDDDLSYFGHAIFYGAKIDYAAETHQIDDGRDCCHEIQFLSIKTSLGFITVSNHNEHNGYYGGFHVVVDLL